MSTKAIDPSFAPGTRVFDASSGSFGVIRYIGPVKGSKNAGATFIGVEWDESGRGTHDGTHSGNTYFKCKLPKTGSFVHPSKLTPLNSMIEAVRARYATPGTCCAVPAISPRRSDAAARRDGVGFD